MTLIGTDDDRLVLQKGVETFWPILADLDDGIRVVSWSSTALRRWSAPASRLSPSSMSHPTKPTGRAVRSSCSDPVHRIAARTDPDIMPRGRLT